MTENKNNDKEPTWDKEFEGNTVEDAIEKALKELSLPKEKVKIQVLTEGQKGLFGMQGAKRAKIRVSILQKDIDLSEKPEQKTPANTPEKPIAPEDSENPTAD